MVNKIVLSIVAIFLVGLVSSVACSSPKLIIDTDAGSDDAIAIFLALSAIARNATIYDLIAITTIYGNTQEKNVEQNIIKILTTANRTDIPIYAGAQKPLIQQIIIGEYDGIDGFGDFNFTDEIKIKINDSIPAAMALISLAKQHSGNLHILAIGPLTNIATAIAIDPDFINHVKIHIMGGSIEGIGNMEPGIEQNFGSDPDSTFMVLNSTIIEPSIIFPWETAINSAIPTEWRSNILGTIDSKIISILNKIERISIEKSSPNWIPADAMTAAAMIFPDIISADPLIINITPVTEGEARGSIIVDYIEMSGKEINAHIIQSIDIDKFKEILITYLS